jgi:predicted metalloprotease with PDZ domain
VKRIRPKSLEPFNFTHANMSSELWFAEGFTQYYGELVLARAGIHSVDDYTRTIAGLVNQVLILRGGKILLPRQAADMQYLLMQGYPSIRITVVTSSPAIILMVVQQH